MFEGWAEFYLMAGSAAAVLIGLIFVVVTLMQDRPRSSIQSGSKLYMGPVVLNVSFVLALSAAALVPNISSHAMGTICALVALWGFVRAVMSIIGIRGLTGADTPHWTDAWYYGVIPSVIFLLLGAVSAGFWVDEGWAPYGVAAIITALLLITIRNEWDLVTWLAPKAESAPSKGPPPSK
jgi:hypothetical protein